MTIFSQLCLHLPLPDEATFENFHTTETNAALVHYLQTFFDDPSNLYIWSGPQQGRTHLLQALCRLARAKSLQPMYLSLKKKSDLEVGILQNLECYDLICLDDLEDIAGNTLWEEALFHLYNRLEAHKKQVVIAASHPPAQLHLYLPDLKSRLSACTIFAIHPLTDPEKLRVLQARAKQRGLILSNQVGQFLLAHVARDNASLFAILDKLDNASLSAKQALTIPFVKRVLGVG
jgi:DnaA family protein